MRKSLAILLTFFVTACSSNSLYHGYSFQDLPNLKDKVKELEIKKATSEEVLIWLGSPTFLETFKENNQIRRELFYLEEQFIYKPLVGKKLQKIKLLRLSFNYQDQLEKSNLLELDGDYYYNNSKFELLNPYQLKFFDQIKKNFEVK
jgi:hypothetical protein